MAISLYIHIPYCIQKCHYCDFSTASLEHQIGKSEYIDLLLHEIKAYSSSIKKIAGENLYTISFGGGTPSLLSVKELEKIFIVINQFFNLDKCKEISLEANPGTLGLEKISELKQLGFNRISLGAQTFNNNILTLLNREHSAKDTENDLKALNKLDVNFSLDLMYGLPNQTLNNFKSDLNKLLDYAPKHISLYNLDLPMKHKLNKNRPSEEAQGQMFFLARDLFLINNYQSYEISNFCKPNNESLHNKAYWEDRNYWGIGVSSHSYLKNKSEWGTRFWNPRKLSQYKSIISDTSNSLNNSTNKEILNKHQALTDFCHTSLRRTQLGLNMQDLAKKFSEITAQKVEKILIGLTHSLLIEKKTNTYIFTPKGQLLSNLAFQKLTFTDEDLD